MERNITQKLTEKEYEKIRTYFSGWQIRTEIEEGQKIYIMSCTEWEMDMIKTFEPVLNDIVLFNLTAWKARLNIANSLRKEWYTISWPQMDFDKENWTLIFKFGKRK